MAMRRWGVRALAVLGILTAIPATPRADSPIRTPLVGTLPRGIESELARLHDPVSVQGQQARGAYIAGLYAHRVGVRGILRTVRSAGMDAVVLDLKDSSGRVTYETAIPELQESVVRWRLDMRSIVAELEAEGIYTIARIVCFADPQLPARMPERSIVHVRRGTPWVSWGTGDTWLDPYNRVNHDMIVELTREAQALGFDEVQLDYVRFPVDDGVQYALYPAEDGTPRAALLVELLRRVDLALTIPVGVDVFGLAAYRDGDPSGLGQDLVAWRDYVEVYSPMLYTNAMRTWMEGEAGRARTLVQAGVQRLRDRVGPEPVIRPYLQGFERGSGDAWGPAYIAEQMIGARAGASDGFLFWHPGSQYGMVQRGMQGPGRSVHPFPIPEERAEARRVSAEARAAAEAPAESEESPRPRRAGPRPGRGAGRAASEASSPSTR